MNQTYPTKPTLLLLSRFGVDVGYVKAQNEFFGMDNVDNLIESLKLSVGNGVTVDIIHLPAVAMALLRSTWAFTEVFFPAREKKPLALNFPGSLVSTASP